MYHLNHHSPKVFKMVALDLKNLRFSYPENKRQTVINIRTWIVEKGKSVFVNGPSGSGKSTLLNLISGILRPTAGSLTVLGHNLGVMSNAQLDQFRANHVGYVFQQFNLIPYLNPVRNIQLARDFCTKDSKTNKEDDIEDLLLKLDLASDLWNKAAKNLSIGQQQRVAIARAFINKPDLLIADEPTSSLDKENRDNFMSTLWDLVGESKTTLVFVSHDTSLSSDFDLNINLNEISEVQK